MLIYPAIDLRGGQCVRLRQGDYHQETIFGDDPPAMARRWVEQGAQYLHIVDLDGAKQGQPNAEPIDFPSQIDGTRTRHFHSIGTPLEYTSVTLKEGWNHEQTQID